ncbi:MULTISPECIES: NfeD family protein [Thalassobacter]|jgi:membrane protein implicated in regulation of membrane protease activity|uniref:NfeD-like C-terminal domain-containing protein n=2 Tax=Thalassobacter stenotrophicus TaxID=266809 RepID=A0A0N7LT45_9RHOB|nr:MULTISPECIES: hypothetical protein [Thalassobacter]PVZ49872.1 hypothetical protein DD557_14705 [Thalassobacter stenotrophicus]CUH59674.1 hypothetical protein THS5294_00960 [Thalassobacter stenotrophicus]SHI91583.1 hypothetical protein SAMN02744035_02039 [Thalassobacter stenotrophicus DSM 16310]
MMLWATWWIWIVAAIILGILEMLAPAFVLLGFAIGAGLVGAGLGLGVLTGFGLPALMAIFAIASLAGWIGLRLMFRIKGDKPKTFDYDIND